MPRLEHGHPGRDPITPQSRIAFEVTKCRTGNGRRGRVIFPPIFLTLCLNKKIVFTTFMYHFMVVILHFKKMALMLQEMRQIRDVRLIVSLRIKTSTYC